MLDIEEQTTGFIGVLIDNTIIYNILENESEFLHSGLSIINFLKYDKNKFVADIIQSQSYNGIKYIFDNKIIYNEIFDETNTNVDLFKKISNQIKEEFENIYIYDYSNDLLIILDNNKFLALDYKNESDIRKYINNVKRK